LITRATFEERINDMIQSKRELADLAVGAGEKWIGNLSNAELNEVFSLG
jgi:SNF2 family DNA or RNA helicase